MITRRHALGGLLAAPVLATAARAAATPGELRLGFQKSGLPVIARRLGSIEQKLAAQGTRVRWVEFSAGPPLLEAMNAGAVDLGWTGDAPPIFAQAARSAIVYVAALPPNGLGEAIIVKADAPIASLADLKGRKVGMTKGSSAHNLTVAALERAGVAFSDITPVYLAPADAAAAFARGAIDAWTIWDPYLAVAQTRGTPRVLATSKDVLTVNTYLLANRDFAAANAGAIDLALAGLRDAVAWADTHRGEVAAALHEVTGVELGAQTLAAERAEFGIRPIDDAIVANQQASADRFFKLGLIPQPVVVREAVWSRPQT